MSAQFTLMIIVYDFVEEFALISLRTLLYVISDLYRAIREDAM